MAFAQEVRDVEPTWQVVTRDGSAARSGPDGVYYTVAELSTGRVVRMDGQAGSFARVRYPKDLSALVPVDEVRVLDQGRVELIKASGLRAPSELMGMPGSWMAVFEPALPEGTALRIAETVKNASGDVVGYRVMPPEPPVSAGYARMYIAADALRDATSAEVAKHLGQAPEPVVPAAVDREEPSVPETQVEDRSPRDLGVREISGNGSETDTETEPEPVEVVDQTVEDERSTAVEEPVQISTGRSSTTPVQAEPPARREPTLLPAELEQLESAFEFARKQPAAEVDQALDELLAEFQRTRDATDDEDRLAWQLDQRIEWLKLRIETRDQRRAIRSALAEADSRAEVLQSRVTEWQRSRTYQLVGMLVESSVYNGERLPRMYRVQAINTVSGAPRTLGYLMPDASMDRMLGSVVGIIGEARFDPQLRLMVIRPERVDVMPE